MNKETLIKVLVRIGAPPSLIDTVLDDKPLEDWLKKNNHPARDTTYDERTARQHILERKIEAASIRTPDRLQT